MNAFVFYTVLSYAVWELLIDPAMLTGKNAVNVMAALIVTGVLLLLLSFLRNFMASALASSAERDMISRPSNTNFHTGDAFPVKLITPPLALIKECVVIVREILHGVSIEDLTLQQDRTQRVLNGRIASLTAIALCCEYNRRTHDDVDSVNANLFRVVLFSQLVLYILSILIIVADTLIVSIATTSGRRISRLYWWSTCAVCVFIVLLVISDLSDFIVDEGRVTTIHVRHISCHILETAWLTTLVGMAVVIPIYVAAAIGKVERVQSSISTQVIRLAKAVTYIGCVGATCAVFAMSRWSGDIVKPSSMRRHLVMVVVIIGIIVGTALATNSDNSRHDYTHRCSSIDDDGDDGDDDDHRHHRHHAASAALMMGAVTRRQPRGSGEGAASPFKL